MCVAICVTSTRFQGPSCAARMTLYWSMSKDDFFDGWWPHLSRVLFSFIKVFRLDAGCVVILMIIVTRRSDVVNLISSSNELRASYWYLVFETLRYLGWAIFSLKSFCDDESANDVMDDLSWRFAYCFASYDLPIKQNLGVDVKLHYARRVVANVLFWNVTWLYDLWRNWWDGHLNVFFWLS